MAIPKKPSARQEDLINYMLEGNRQQVSDFVSRNSKAMTKFFLRHDSEFNLDDFIRTVKSTDPEGLRHCRLYIANCTKNWAHKMPEKNIDLPPELRTEYRRVRKEQRKIKNQETRAQTWKDARAEWEALKETGKRLRSSSWAMTPILVGKGTAEISAGIFSALNFSKPQRILAQTAAYSAAAAPFVLKSTFATSLMAMVAGTTLDEAKAVIPAAAGIETNITDDRLNERFGQQSSPHVLSYATPPISGLGEMIQGIITQPDISQTDPHAIYQPLFSLIEKGESTVGGYNAVYIPYVEANKDVKFNLIDKTVNEIRALQKQMKDEGFDSTALGRYQIIGDTMAYLVKKMKLTGDEIFTADLQDRMAITLLKRRGVESYLSGNMDEERFMWHLSREWASFPKDLATGESYWKGIGNNKAKISTNEMLIGIRAAGTLAGLSVPNSTTLSMNLPSGSKIPIPQSSPRELNNG